MAVIRVKRGTTTPTTSNLTNVGELAFDYTNNVLYARNSTSVVKIGGEMELIHTYEASASSYQWVHTFSNSYLYKIHVLTSTTPGITESSTSYISYLSSSLTSLGGAYTNMMVNDVNTGVTKSSAKNITSFVINDAYSASVTPTSAYTKVLDFEMTPLAHTSATTHYQWAVYGNAVTTGSDQANVPITHTVFSHSVDGPIHGILINPQFDAGSVDSIAISIWRTKRK